MNFLEGFILGVLIGTFLLLNYLAFWLIGKEIFKE